jgi:hypothetical protein
LGPDAARPVGGPPHRSRGEKLIVFDIVFTDRDTNNPAADERFAEAMKKIPGGSFLAAGQCPVRKRR